MNSFSIKTFGCKVNQYDSRKLAEDLLQRGYQHDNTCSSDTLIINGCSVTARSEQKILQFIRHYLNKKPSAQIIITGCYANRLLQTGNKTDIPATIIPGKNYLLWNKHFPVIRQINPLQSTVQFSERTRAFIKIQDGCRQFCSYCIVPFVRGPNRSRHPSEIFSELEQTQKEGFKEIVLTGIHIGQYGNDFSDNISLANLLKQIQCRFSFDRIRLSSIELKEVTPELIEILRETPFCKHLHIPLQSGSNRILEKMNRTYNHEEFRKVLEDLQASIPLLGVSTDIIAGFPGESAHDLEQTREFLSDFNFVRVHVFPYSRRPFTAAASYPERISPPEIKYRSALLREDANHSIWRFYSSMKNKTVRILSEDFSQGTLRGYSENYMTVEVFPTSQVFPNTILQVKGYKVKQEKNGTVLLAQSERREIIQSLIPAG